MALFLKMAVVCLAFTLAGSAQITFSPQGPQLTAPPSNTPPEQRCVLAGRVNNSTTGEPVKKATVRLTMRATGVVANGRPSSQGYSGTSESDGTFRIESIEPGDYSLSGQHAGFLNTNYGAKSAMQMGTTLSFKASQQMTDISLGLIPQAVISGKIVDEEGEPANRAMVQAMRQSWMRGKLRYMPANMAVTNDLGEFRLSNLPPGKYYLSVSSQRNFVGMPDENAPETKPDGKPDIRPIRTFYPNAVALANATALEVKAGQDLPGTDVRLHSAQTYHVRGKVVGALAGEGDKEQQVSVSLTPRDDEMPMFFGNAGGLGKDHKFDISGIAPGSYYLNLYALGGRLRTMGRQAVDVGSGDANDLVITAVPAGSLRGVVRLDGNPPTGSAPVKVSSVNVHLVPSDLGTMMSPGGMGSTQADGTFSLDGIASGRYVIQANAPKGAYVKSIRLGNQEALGKELDFSQGASGEVDVVLRYGPAEVDGTVQVAQNGGTANAGQNNLPTSLVILVPQVLNDDGSGMLFGNTNQAATFNVTQVPPGRYRAYALENGSVSQLQDPAVLKELEGKGTDVEVKENDKKQIQLTLISANDLQQIFTKLGIDTPQ